MSEALLALERLGQTMQDVMYLKDMRIKFLERELGGARETLELLRRAAAPYSRSVCGQHNCSNVNLSAEHLCLACELRAALAPKESEQ